MKLREYQNNAIIKIRSSFAKGNNRLILCAPTGSGKTIIFCKIAQLTTLKNNKVLIATDRKELLTQTGNKLELFDVDFGIIKANQKIIPKNKAVVCMLETLKRRLKNQNYIDFIQKFDLIILDEVHKNSFNKLFENLSNNQKVIGATATPYRKGKMKPLKDFYDEIIEVTTINELIVEGFLANPVSYGIAQNLDNIKTVRGEYDLIQLSEHYQKEKIYTGIYQNYIKYTPNKKALIFCVSIKNSIEVTKDLQKHDLNCKHLDSTMSDIERNEILEWFYSTPDAILSNVGILTTGFDCPDIEVIILYRATKSLPLFLQMVGRGSRVTDTKDKFTILDFGNNIKNHGFWEEDRLWSLENAKINKKKKTDVPASKECPKCFALIAASSKNCKYCGYEYPEKKKTVIEMILKKLSPSEIQRFSNNCNIKELEEIRQLKNYKIGWVLHRLQGYNDFLEYAKIKGYKKGWAGFQYNRYNN